MALIPDAQLYDWEAGETVGVPGGIPSGSNIVPIVVDSTGATDVASGINSAISSAVAGDVLTLGAGTYRIDSPIEFGTKKNVILRGAGETTIIDNRSTYNAGIYVGSEGDYLHNYGVANVTGSPVKGATTITVSSTALVVDGMMCRIVLGNDDDLPVLHTSKYAGLRSQHVRIVSHDASTITFEPPLAFGLPSALSPTVSLYQTQAEFVGIEDLVIDNTNSSVAKAVYFAQAYGCWIKNVTSTDATSFHFDFVWSLQCEIRHCWVEGRNGSPGPGGAGIIFETEVCNTLVEDNVLLDIFPLIEVNKASTGNVVAYNFCKGSNGGSGILGCSIDTNHGPHNSFNLFEGNYAEKIQSDGYFGGESELTIFRNWVSGVNDDVSDLAVCVWLGRFTRNAGIVGNILGGPGETYSYEVNGVTFSSGTRHIYTFGMPFMGNSTATGTAQPSLGDNWSDWAGYLAAAQGAAAGPTGWAEGDLDVKATLTRKGNYNYSTSSIPAGESMGADPLPDSLFRSAKPSYFGALAWPPFDPESPGTPSFEDIPAGYRYINGEDPAEPTDAVTFTAVTVGLLNIGT